MYIDSDEIRIQSNFSVLAATLYMPTPAKTLYT